MLVVNANFGCGSSREHAPQGLAAPASAPSIGESFSEIFLGNCGGARHAVLHGRHGIDRRAAVADRAAPETIVDANVETGVITAGR